MMNQQQESLALLPAPPPGGMGVAPTTPPEDGILDLKDLKQALNAEVLKAQQRMMINTQNQIADNCTKNGVPPKQLLLYLVR